MLGEILAGAGLLGGLFGSDDEQTVTQQQQLPSFLQPYAPLYAQAGYNLFNQPFNPYPYETVAPFTQDQNAAMDMVRQRALAGSPVTNAAQQQQMATIQGGYLNQPSNPFLQQMQATMRGDYLNPQTNPYLQQTYDLAANRMGDAFSRGTAAQTDANFARAGAFGGSAWQEAQEGNQRAFGDALAGLGANIFGNNYAQERSRQDAAQQFGANQFANNFARERALQQGAAQVSPNFASQDYRDAEALLRTGGMQQGLGQQYLTDDASRFAQAQQYPYQQFGVFGQLFNPNLGSQTSQTMPGVSPFAGALGGALGGLGVYNMGSQAGIWGNSGNTGSLLGPASTYSTPWMGGGTGLTPPTGFSWGQ